MIGMMYLVLTAMLALNVSTDILNGFTVVDNSLHASIDGNDNRNGNFYYRFWKSSKREEVKVGPWYKKSQELKGKADEAFNFVQNFKEQIVRYSDGDAAVDKRIEKNKDVEGYDPTRYLESKDNRDAAPRYAIDEEHGAELKQVLSDYLAYLCQLTDTGEYGQQRRDELKMIFNTDDVYMETEKREMPWEVAMFYDMPSAAAVTLLSKIQNDIRATEGQMIQYLYDRTDANDITVNRMSAYVIPRSERVAVGDRYEAQLLLAGVDTLQQPEYYVNGQKIGNDGMYTFTAAGVGEHTYSGVIKYRNNAGEPVEAHFSQRYIVEEGLKMPDKQDKLSPNVAITNRDLTVVYQGYGHTFMVTSTTIPAANLNVSAQGASVSKISPGLFRIQATASPGHDVTINVTGSYQGKTVSLGSEKFRVKRLPKPMPSLSVGGREFTGGKIARGQLLNQGATVVASYGEDALIKADFTVQSFQIYAQGKYLQSNGPHYSGEQLALLKTLSMGTPVMFLGIKAKGLGGVILDLRPISFVLN